jgi:membrane protease YdiL (CAAX protease family)
MSQVEANARTEARSGATTPIAIALAVAMLLLRIRIMRAPDATRIALVVAVFAAILVASLAVPVARDFARVRPPVVAAVGLAAIGLATLVAGRPVAASLGTSAIPLALFAAVAEEALFRRAAYGWLVGSGPAVAIIGSALLFAAVHVPLYGVAAFPVDVGAGLLLSWQRWASGTWIVPASTHAAANLLAVVLR